MLYSIDGLGEACKIYTSKKQVVYKCIGIVFADNFSQAISMIFNKLVMFLVSFLVERKEMVIFLPRQLLYSIQHGERYPSLSLETKGHTMKSPQSRHEKFFFSKTSYFFLNHIL